MLAIKFIRTFIILLKTPLSYEIIANCATFVAYFR